jgi:hypothetical protein
MKETQKSIYYITGELELSLIKAALAGWQQEVEGTPQGTWQ